MKNPQEHLPRITSSSGDQSVANPPEENTFYVMLPCEVKDFKDFVAGLLGKPQELRGEVAGSFKVGYAEITNIYHLLEQRMAKQNDASLLHFMITVFYDDGQSVVHNKVADFESFHPTTPCHPTAVKISATYLIKFRGHEIPEKQEIEVSFATHEDYREGPMRFFRSGSFFEFRIVHTERTWATDIAGLLKNHVSTVISKPEGASKFFRRHADEFAVYFSQIVFLVSVFVWTNVALSVIGATMATPESLKNMAMFIVKSVPAFAVLIVMIIAIRAYVERTSFFFRQAYIVFTKQDIDRYEKDQKHLFWAAVRYVLVWVISVATGVFSNVLYSKNWFW